MKKIILTGTAAISLLFFSHQARAQDSFYAYSHARISYVQGDVRVERSNDLGVETGEVNLALASGDRVITEDGLAEIGFGRNNFLRLDNYSIVEIGQLPDSDNDHFSLNLHQGRAYLRISYLSREKVFALNTPDASFYILERGLCRLEVQEEGGTEATVIEGSLEASGQEEALPVEAGESIVASDGYLTETNDTRAFAGDDFSRWNAERDRLILETSYEGSSYLPEEIREYEPELSSYGRWVYERPYGYVWVPTITYVDWRPYLLGRWVWYPRLGWTWISAEPWGWAVYHYGRWHWRLGLGWYWIPTVYWGPAWVYWYWDADFIGWCPLSYWNRPVVIINNYFYDRYHDHYYPVHSRALVMVRRNELQARHSAHTLVRPEELRGREKIRLESRQPRIEPVVSSGLKARGQTLKTSGMRESLKGQGSTVSKSNLKRDVSSSATSRTGVKLSREKLTTFTSRINAENQRSKAVKSYSPSSAVSRERLNQTVSDRERQAEQKRLDSGQQKIRVYPERSEVTLKKNYNQSSTNEINSRPRTRESITAYRLRNEGPSSSINHPEKPASGSNYQNQTRKSSSYNLPSLSRPYNQPALKARNEGSPGRGISPSRSSQDQRIKSQAPSRPDSSQSGRRKKG